MAHIPSLWTHETLPTTLTLAVDDFGIKLFATNDATHLLDALKKDYSIAVNPSGSKYYGLTIKCNYPGDYVDISMPSSVRKVLEYFQHPKPPHPQHSPHA